MPGAPCYWWVEVEEVIFGPWISGQVEVVYQAVSPSGYADPTIEEGDRVEVFGFYTSEEGQHYVSLIGSWDYYIIVYAGTITGRTTEDGNPVDDTYVWLYNSSNQLVGETYSNSNGDYQFDDVPPGSDYRLEFLFDPCLDCMCGYPACMVCFVDNTPRYGITVYAGQTTTVDIDCTDL